MRPKTITYLFVSVVSLMPMTAQGAHLPGQIIVNPANPAWLVYNRDADRDGRLDPFFLSGPGGPEGHPTSHRRPLAGPSG